MESEASERLPILLAGVLVALLLSPIARAAENVNTCEQCHADPDFLVTNKKLYDYYQQWSGSIHKQEGVGCDDCHGGNAAAADKDGAHRDGVKATDPTSGIYYKNVPDTCGTCHDEILEGFVKSEHYAHVEKKKEEEQGPTCVTCHGSMNSEVLNVNTVSDSCARCHNEKRDNHPDNPAKARAILNRFLSIQHFYRYISVRAEPKEAKDFFSKIDPSMRQLAVTWHTFDLETIERETGVLLAALKAKRGELLSRQAVPGK